VAPPIQSNVGARLSSVNTLLLAQCVAEAKKNGGDGILLKAEQTDFLGTYPTDNATAVTRGNVTTAAGSGVSVPIIRREGQYFVIKYVD